MRAPVLTDGTVTLDGFRIADWRAHLGGEDDEFARRFGWSPGDSTEETVRRAIRAWQSGWWREGRVRAWAVRTGDELVGGCELRLRADAIADLSYWTLAPHRGRGYATRAARLVSRHAFYEMQIARIELSIEPDNAASLAVARAGRIHRRRRAAPQGRPRRATPRRGALVPARDGPTGDSPRTLAVTTPCRVRATPPTASTPVCHTGVTDA